MGLERSPERQDILRSSGLKTMGSGAADVGKQNGVSLGGERWRKDSGQAEAQPLSLPESPRNRLKLPAKGSWPPPCCTCNVSGEKQHSVGTTSTRPCTAHFHL